MADYVAVKVEDVLARVDPTDSFAGSEVIVPGRLMYFGLLRHFKVALVHEQDETRFNHWLMVAGIGAETLRVRQEGSFPEEVTRLRADHGPVAFAVTSSPDDTLALLREGIATMTFSHPTYARSEWHPDRERSLRGWDAITEEVERQALLRATDERVTADIDKRWE